MQHSAKITGSPVKPEWLSRSDLTEDITDAYGDATGDYEREVIAHFTVSTQAVDGGINNPDDWRYAEWKDLIGAEIEGIGYVSRFDLNKLGLDTLDLDGVAR